MPKFDSASLKDKLDGRELDLSLNDLAVVPVKELAALPRATHLDLSCNLLTTLQPEFCQLTHLVKVDLSKNAITELPSAIGDLSRLQHLDLFSNKLTTLPVGLCHLKNLRWLDLKENPLDDQLQKVAGDCLDDNQCKTCAKNIIAFMKNVQSEQERQLQKRLELKRELEAKKKMEGEREREQLKAQRKAVKEQRKRDYEAAQVLKQKEDKKKTKVTAKTKSKPAVQPSNGVKADKDKKKTKKGGPGFCSIFLALMIAGIAVVVGAYFYCESNPPAPWCREVKGQVNTYYQMALQTVKQYTKKEV